MTARTKVGGYEIVALIVNGYMGKVYRCNPKSFEFS
jgi:hypothetical protein